MDIITMKDRVTGLEAHLRELRSKSDMFAKVQGIEESLEKTRGKIEGLKESEETYKEDLSKLLEKKEKALAPTIKELFERTTTILPTGEAVFEIDSGKVFIGWKKDGHTTAYNGLSGGEKVCFDSALCNALGAEIIIMEAAEMDGENLETMLKMLADIKPQIILNTCHSIGDVPEPFSAVKL